MRLILALFTYCLNHPPFFSSLHVKQLLEAKNAPQIPIYNTKLSIKGRICNPTPLVHQAMTKKTIFYKNNNKER